MKKFIGIVSIALALFSCIKKGDDVWVEAPVEKKIELHIHAGHNYTAAPYHNATAGVKIEVYKQATQGTQQLVWDTTFAARSLQLYPHLPQKFVIEKTWPVYDSKETLQARYTITYATPAGSVTQTATEALVPGKDFAFLDVNI